jgi:transporter family-2 protein
MGVLNARLGRALGEPLHAPVVLLIIAFGASLVLSLSLTQSLPNISNLSVAQPIDFAGGLIVCFYVLSATLLAPRLGIGNFILYAVVTQTITSAVIDHFGLFGVLVREVSFKRMVGIVIVIVGLVITQWASNQSPLEVS